MSRVAEWLRLLIRSAFPPHVCNAHGEIAIAIATGRPAPECCMEMFCRRIAEDNAILRRYFEARMAEALRDVDTR